MYLYKYDINVDCVFFHLFTISLLRHLNVFDMKEKQMHVKVKGTWLGLTAADFLFI